MKKIALVWFRRDLRTVENNAFIEACSQYDSVIPLYIYDDRHPNNITGAQTWWLHHSLTALNKRLNTQGLSLILRKGNPLDILKQIIKDFNVDALYWNRCYEPYEISRDTAIKSRLIEEGVAVQSFNSSLLNEPWTIKNSSGDFFKVFTPYWRCCRKNLLAPSIQTANPKKTKLNIASESLDSWNLLPTLDWAKDFPKRWTPGEEGAHSKLEEFIQHQLKGYTTNRDFPAQDATSHLSPHLHFGEISPWTIVRALETASLDPKTDLNSAERFLSELGWREFSTYLLYHFPKLPSENFKDKFNAFPWQNDEELFGYWKKGLTGFPIVDAGMRELWATGYMHNRVRMIVASFLTKDLFIDWRKGAAWFLYTLLDADLANNSASWQWVAGCGADAAPYFRIFNPLLQSEKFDLKGDYIRQWVPELSKLEGPTIHSPWADAKSSFFCLDNNYPKPIVDHQEARAKALYFYNQLK